MSSLNNKTNEYCILSIVFNKKKIVLKRKMSRNVQTSKSIEINAYTSHTQATILRGKSFNKKSRSFPNNLENHSAKYMIIGLCINSLS